MHGRRSPLFELGERSPVSQPAGHLMRTASVPQSKIHDTVRNQGPTKLKKKTDQALCRQWYSQVDGAADCAHPPLLAMRPPLPSRHVTAHPLPPHFGGACHTCREASLLTSGGSPTAALYAYRFLYGSSKL